MPSTARGAIAEGAGFNTGATWGTAIVLDVDDGLKISGEELAGGEEALEVEEIGDAAGALVEKGNESWLGPIRGNLRYGGNCGRFMAHIFGTEATTANTGTMSHVLDFADDLARFFTFCRGVDATQKWWEWSSLKMEEFVIAWTNGGRLTYEARCVGHSLSEDTAVNTRTVTSTVLVPAGRAQIMGADAVLRMNAQAGGALAGGDVKKIVSGKLTFRRELSRPFETSGVGKMSEPQGVKAAEVLLDLDLERFSTTEYRTQWNAAGKPAPQKADLVFSSGITPATGLEMKFAFQFPNIALSAPPQAPAQGPGLIPHKLMYKAVKATAAPTGMTGVTAAARCSVEDERLSSYFA
jgi:hypothetical protein